MRSLVLEAAVEALSRQGRPFALIHEAALVAYGLDNNVFPYGIDVLVEDVGDWEGVPPDVDGTPLRLWDHVPSLSLERACLVHNEPYGCDVVRPELVLDTLVLSPDIELLWEVRAGLAMVLLADQMTDDELMEYDRYVRYL